MPSLGAISALSRETKLGKNIVRCYKIVICTNFGFGIGLFVFRYQIHLNLHPKNDQKSHVGTGAIIFGSWQVSKPPLLGSDRPSSTQFGVLKALPGSPKCSCGRPMEAMLTSCCASSICRHIFCFETECVCNASQLSSRNLLSALGVRFATAHVRRHAHTHIYTNTHTHTHTHTHAHTPTHSRPHNLVCPRANTTHIHTHTRTLKNTHTHTHTPTRTHTHTHPYTHTQIHTPTHAHTHPHTWGVLVSKAPSPVLKLLLLPSCRAFWTSSDITAD